MVDKESPNPVPDPDDPELCQLLRETRLRVTAIFRAYEIDEAHATDVLAALWVLVALTEAGWRERFRQLVDAVETACRELRAELGPHEEEEHEPYVH